MISQQSLFSHCCIRILRFIVSTTRETTLVLMTSVTMVDLARCQRQQLLIKFFWCEKPLFHSLYISFQVTFVLASTLVTLPFVPICFCCQVSQSGAAFICSRVMVSATRFCYPSGGAEITVAPDGTSRIIYIAVSIQRAYVELFHVPNVTHVYSSESIDECFQQMQVNETDVIFTRRPLLDDESAIYYVPIATEVYVNEIVTGYNYSQYKQSVDELEDSGTTLFRNFTIYDPTAVSLLFVYLTLLFIISRLAHRLELKCTKYSPRRRVSWRKVEGSIKYRASDTTKVVKFFLHMSFFFLGAPFLAKFSTNQVVTNPPDITTTYSQIMEKALKIVVSEELVDDHLFRPSAESIKKNDIHAQLYRYKEKNSIKFIVPRSAETITAFDEVTKPIHDGEAVMFAANQISDGFRDAFCSWTDQSSLVQVFIVTDPSSTEMLTGLPFRRGFIDSFLQERLRRIFEADILEAILKTNRQYAGFEFDRFSTTREHRSRQLTLCMTDHLLREQKETRPPGLKSFALFLAMYFSFVSFVAIVHMIHSNSHARKIRAIKAG